MDLGAPDMLGGDRALLTGCETLETLTGGVEGSQNGMDTTAAVDEARTGDTQAAEAGVGTKGATDRGIRRDEIEVYTSVLHLGELGCLAGVP